MKRKPNPQKADPTWTKETFARARKARDVLPEIFGTAHEDLDVASRCAVSGFGAPKRQLSF
jgi:hypothetical protein